MLLTKYYIVCNGCGESTTKKANGDLGKVRMESIKDGWDVGYDDTDMCPSCSEKAPELRGRQDDGNAPVSPGAAPDKPVKKEEKKPAPPAPEAPVNSAADDEDF